MMMMSPRATQFTQVSLRNGNRAEPVEIWRARQFIHEHSDEGLSLTKVAKSVHISPNYLSEGSKK
jgi:YesN/AraC family two-component response regulator